MLDLIPLRLSLLGVWLVWTSLAGPAAQAADPLPPSTPAASQLVVLPPKIVLDGPAAQQRVLAEWVDQEAGLGIADNPTWRLEDPALARLENGHVRPLRNGTTRLWVQVGDQQASAELTVQNFTQPQRWEFTRHVLPILSKTGCNQGACHGALAGKGGFRLSLRGYDPYGDYFNITQESRGRRIEPSQPGRSLLLMKPTGAVPHQGGLRLDVASRDYRIVADWLIAGAEPPQADDAALDRIEVLPTQLNLAIHQTQPLIVRAHYRDGRIEDVTGWAKFTATQESVAQVSADGVVKVVGPGEGAISVWFSSQIVVAQITSAYPHQIPAEIYANAPRANFIDDMVLAKLRDLHLAPSPRASDQFFLRRIYIDTIGRIPTEAEAVAFLADAAPDKRQRLIDQLLARPEFVDYWTFRWSDVLVINGRRIRPAAVKAYHAWLRQHVRSNTPWDRLVREIITARGGSIDHGATNFYALHQTPEDMAENVSQAFLGLSINCAKCHNHPLEKWTNGQYYAMANLFARVRAKGWGGESRSGDGLRTLTVEDQGELIQPLTGKPQLPTPLDGTPLALDDPRDRREHLADWLTSPQNPYFARSIANRVWANFLGTGLVESVDDLRISNPASNEPLLRALAQHLIEHQFNLKALMRTILQSETYQRSSDVLPENQHDRRFYSRYYPRRMMAEVLLDAVVQVTEVPDEFVTIRHNGMDFEKTAEYAKGTRAIQLFDSAVDSPFLDRFGRNRRDIVCECERSNTPTMVQVLHLHNGDTLNQRLQATQGWITQLAAQSAPPVDQIGPIYLRVLGRYPTPHELQQWQAELAQNSDVPRRELLEDVAWSLLSSREFLFQH